MRKVLATFVAALTMAGIGALAHPRPVAADCAANNFTLFVDWFEGGVGQSFCFDLTGNWPNLANIPGPCHANRDWNDCASSAIVNLSQVNCLAFFRDANYVTRMYTFWGPETNHTENLLSPNDALSSVKQYQKVPATPAGNC